MTQSHKIGCRICKHYQFDGTCAAFPAGIPIGFLSGQDTHIQPVKGQKNDIVFEWIAPEEQRQRAIEAIERHKAIKKVVV